MNLSENQHQQKFTNNYCLSNIFKPFLLFILLFLIPFNFTLAQDSKSQMFLVHEDRVKPSMKATYEEISKDFKNQCEKYNIQNVRYLTATTSDGKYLYLTPIKNMAELDDRPIMALQEKMGKAAFSAMFDQFDKCYDNHGSYIIHLDKDLSYDPEGINPSPEGKDYRRYYYIHYTPENSENLTKSMKKVKELYKKKGSKVYYRVYRSGFGNIGSYLLVAVAGKNGLEYEKTGEENRTLLGSENKEVFDELFKYVTKFESTIGAVRPDLSYSPK